MPLKPPDHVGWQPTLRLPCLSPRRGRSLRRGVTFLAAWFLLTAGCALAAVDSADCERAGRDAEVAAGLPAGLLLALGQVESGRFDPVRERSVAWPWVIDVAGQGQFFPDKDSVLRTTRALLNSGQRNIDVGCYQISLLHHPLAFADLAEAFDPTANARYAARFLLSLYERYGDWGAAVAAYHSADPARGAPYRALVFAAWQPMASRAYYPLGKNLLPDVKVWTPSPPGSAPQVISLRGVATPSVGGLPRIITPGR